MEHHTREPHDVRTDTHAPETAPGAHGHHSSPRAGEHPRAGEWAEERAARSGTETGRLSAPRPRTEAGAEEEAEREFDSGERFQARWRRIQSDFVDDPHASVAAADSLVGEVIEQLTARLNERKRRIESGWQRRSEGGSDTERLRVALREYRSLLDQLTAVSR
ncbi:hypothetical protein [Thermobifida halotolerans]|uniref:hypothetical protein n=1 Tax=Thermobifida halotolerans TaxID=483545 RepID=UPI000AB5924C|nr:hypothetical protein [Thermobifida halotolerans]